MSSKIDDIVKLGELRKEGLLTEEEFLKEKEDILNKKVLTEAEIEYINNKPVYNKISGEGDNYLKKTVLNAGNSTFAIGIVTPILSFVFSAFVNNFSTSYAILYSVISLLICIPWIIWGNKIREDTLEDLESSFKLVSKASFYALFVLIGIFLCGGLVGILAIVACIELFIARKKIKAYL